MVLELMFFSPTREQINNARVDLPRETEWVCLCTLDKLWCAETILTPPGFSNKRPSKLFRVKCDLILSFEQVNLTAAFIPHHVTLSAVEADDLDDEQ